jgi:hypothetical protein
MGGARISASRKFSAEELTTALENLVVAFSVAHIGASIEALERCLREGRSTRVDLVEALAVELEQAVADRDPFIANLETSLRHELGHLLGQRAGDAVSRALETGMHAAGSRSDLRAIMRMLPAICRRIHGPLLDFLAAQRKASQHNARLIQAIADQGIESIDAFKLIENLQRERAAAQEAYDRLVAADGNF